MTPFLSMSANLQTLVLIGLLLLIPVGFYLALEAQELSDRHRLSAWALLPAVLALALLIGLTTALSLEGRPEETWGPARTLAALPFALYPGLIAASFALFTALSRILKARRKGTLSRASIKESVDNLPAGLCFVSDTGMILLANRAMDDLSYTLTGKALLNPYDFWQTAARGPLKRGARRVRDLENPTIRLADGRTWSLSRRTIKSDGRFLTRMTAVDTTDLDVLRARLRLDNSRLIHMGVRLRSYTRHIEATKVREERLAAKMRIHDELGYALMATRHLVGRLKAGQASTEEVDTILALWKTNMALFQGLSQQEPIAALDKLSQSASALGLRLLTFGELPSHEASAQLIVRAAGESLANAARHARARELYMTIKEADDTYTVSFQNDGSLPQRAVQEGGGLTSLRQSVEETGGQMTVEHAPYFTLTIRLPKQGG